MRLLHSKWYDPCPVAARIQDVRVEYRRKWCKQEELLCLLVRLAAKNAAKVVGLYPQKGILAPGADADIVFLKKENWLTKIDLSTILNFSEWLLPTSVMSNGKWIYRDLRFTPKIGTGRYLRDTKPYSFVI
jgi:cytosine/adenosine deaminase-related metal-dependent hydrolase